MFSFTLKNICKNQLISNRNTAQLYLKKYNLLLPEVYLMDAAFFKLAQIWFPHGCLLFGKVDTDHLFIAYDEGFPYAVAILTYYFGLDSPEADPDFKRPYETVTIEYKIYTTLSTEMLEHLRSTGYALLTRNKITNEDPRLVSISFDINTVFEDMLNNQKPWYFKD